MTHSHDETHDHAPSQGHDNGPPGEYEIISRALQELLDNLKQKFDVIVVNNEALENETKSLLLMGVADTNLFVLDSRRTPASQIIKTDILKEEFKLPNMWFVLNRAGYNPNVMVELSAWGNIRT